VFNGPVSHGSQLVWGNSSMSQNQDQSNPIAPGFEAIAKAVVDTLRQLPILGVSDEDLEDASAVSEELLNEAVQPEPDRGVIRRAVAALKGYLAPIATRGHGWGLDRRRGERTGPDRTSQHRPVDQA
jgi:hypothetical protein